MTSYTQPNIVLSNYINRDLIFFGQFAVQSIETWQANSSTGNTPMTIKYSVPMVTHSFPVPTHLISICW